MDGDGMMVIYVSTIVAGILTITILTLVGILPNDQPFYEYWLGREGEE